MKDKLGDRMKAYEALAETRLMPKLPILARVDGRAFHSFTRGLPRPYCPTLSFIMQRTALELAQETNACMAYTQSDEITLVWYASDPKSQVWFAGRHTKMVSQIAALATLHFYRLCAMALPEYADRLPTFDARVWQVPDLTEAANAFLWREWDATKNSITMAASSVYSHKELHGKNGSQKQEMLFQKGINWNDYPAFFKRGAFVRRRVEAIKFSAVELAALPEKHAARTNPDLVVERSVWDVADMPPFGTVTNREAVIFEGAEPITATAEQPTPQENATPTI